MSKKKIIRSAAAVLTVSAILCQPIAAISQISLSEPPGIELMWENAGSVTFDVSIVNSKIKITLNIPGKSGTTFKDGTVTLTKVSGSQSGVVREWTGLSSSSSTFSFTNNTYTPIKGGYTVDYKITAVRNGVSETIYGTKSLTYAG